MRLRKQPTTDMPMRVIRRGPRTAWRIGMGVIMMQVSPRVIAAIALRADAQSSRAFGSK